MKFYPVLIAFSLIIVGIAAASDERSPYSNLPESRFNLRDANESLYDAPQDSFMNPLNVMYLGIFNGPSLQNPGSYQPDLNGRPNLDRPVHLKNFLSLGYNLSEKVAITGSVYWIWQPVPKQRLLLQDPFVRISDNSFFHNGNLNLYSDVRFHFPVTRDSRYSDLLFGAQTFHALTYNIESTRFMLGAYGSLRANWYGKEGLGNDLELYLAPSISYQLSPTTSLSLLYEIQKSHSFGKRIGAFNDDETDLAPGFNWDITPQLSFNPYLNILTSGEVSMRATSIGMLLSWIMI